jgi:hypothetical protein
MPFKAGRRVSNVTDRRRVLRGGRRGTDARDSRPLSSRTCQCGAVAVLNAVITSQPGLLLRYHCVACGQSAVVQIAPAGRRVEVSKSL